MPVDRLGKTEQSTGMIILRHMVELSLSLSLVSITLSVIPDLSHTLQYFQQELAQQHQQQICGSARAFVANLKAAGTEASMLAYWQSMVDDSLANCSSNNGIILHQQGPGPNWIYRLPPEPNDLRD